MLTSTTTQLFQIECKISLQDQFNRFKGTAELDSHQKEL